VSTKLEYYEQQNELQQGQAAMFRALPEHMERLHQWEMLNLEQALFFHQIRLEHAKNGNGALESKHAQQVKHLSQPPYRK
jgi:hypothetical protein